MLINKRIKPFYEEPGDGGGSGGGAGKDPEKKDLEKKDPEGGAVDYDKLASLITGKQTVAEDQVLKGFFKQQGLSKEEMDKAIAEFKSKRESEKPDFDKLNGELTAAKKAALDAKMETEAFKMASSLGVDPQAMAYVYKLADKSEVIVDGKISTDKLSEALNKVLEDVPQFKVTKKESKGMSFKVGSDGKDDKPDDKEAMMRKAFGLE